MSNSQHMYEIKNRRSFKAYRFLPGHAFILHYHYHFKVDDYDITFAQHTYVQVGI